jgi:hypothetical protein
MQQNIRSYQPLTVTHNRLSTWTGLGSALATLWNESSIPVSVSGTLNIIGYLACISVLHITMPAILSVETFNTTAPLLANTLGIPEFRDSATVGYVKTLFTVS